MARRLVFALACVLAIATAAASNSYCASLTKGDCTSIPLGCSWDETQKSCFAGATMTKKAKELVESHRHQDGPNIPYPWYTTQQRTHTFTTKEFLSIAEEQSQRVSDDGFIQQAFYIYPATPFSMRDKADTIVRGMKGVFTTNPAKPGWVHEVIFLTNLAGQDYCFVNAVRQLTVRSTKPQDPVRAQIRGNEPFWGVDVDRYITTYEKAGTLAIDYVREARGGAYANGTGAEVFYPLRLTRDYNTTSGERGFMLDLGQHFPVAIDAWFNLTLASTCPQAEIRVSAEHPPLEHGPRGVEPDHHKYFPRRSRH